MEKELMSTKTERKSDIAYGRSLDGYRYVVIQMGNSANYMMRICDWNDHLEVWYGCPNNGQSYMLISRVEFSRAMRKIKAKHGVKFSIKTEWGTNASQSSDT